MNTRERGMAIKTDINKQGWEKSDFPVACEKCYGENPYMRMLKQNYGQECRICFRPFTVFKWKGDRGIYKRTCVCNSCSKDKNLCQVCTLDLEFGLPMEIRDKRCGVNGKYLMNDNFVNQTSKKVKPPPPSIPPPEPRNAYEAKEAVFIPEEQEDSDQQNAARPIVSQQQAEKQQGNLELSQNAEQAQNKQSSQKLLQKAEEAENDAEKNGVKPQQQVENENPDSQ